MEKNVIFFLCDEKIG